MASLRLLVPPDSRRAGPDVVLDVSESTRREPAEGLPLFGSDRLARVHAARWLEKHGFGTGSPFRR